MQWVKSQIFARIALVFEDVRLGWLRYRESAVSCDIYDSLTSERKERLQNKKALIQLKLRACEQRIEALRGNLRGDIKRPDLKRVA